MGGGLRFSGALTSSSVARSEGEWEGDGDPNCGFCPRDGGGGGGRLRKELWSVREGSGGGARESVWSSKNVGDGRRLVGGREPSNRLVSPVREDPLGNFAGDSLAFCSNMFLRSFTAGVTLTSTSCESADIEKRGAGNQQQDKSWQNGGDCKTK